MVHSFHIGHSYSDRNVKIFPHSAKGEYDDPYDLMSTANALMHPSQYGLSGPGLNGPHLNYLGWLPMDRIFYFGRDGRQNHKIRVSSLSVPHKNTMHWLLIMIPYDRDDPENVFTVELRTPIMHDSGIKQASIIIHRISQIGSSYYSIIITHSNEFYELTEGTEWVHFIDYDSTGKYQFIRLSVVKINLTEHYADLKIISTFDPVSVPWFSIKTSV
ncbi:unnamed protein product [Dracunculus medinensis]|uniref:DPPIV_N domain-containing protein n=1 Tax=Dracunculus medinensis TaxID=318479 RepID=A0A0N4UKZ8_DRAME|nr:unnamed protein product [Dracunculus medinensis]